MVGVQARPSQEAMGVVGTPCVVVAMHLVEVVDQMLVRNLEDVVLRSPVAEVSIRVCPRAVQDVVVEAEASAERRMAILSPMLLLLNSVLGAQVAARARRAFGHASSSMTLR